MDCTIQSVFFSPQSLHQTLLWAQSTSCDAPRDGKVGLGKESPMPLFPQHSIPVPIQNPRDKQRQMTVTKSRSIIITDLFVNVSVAPQNTAQNAPLINSIRTTFFIEILNKFVSYGAVGNFGRLPCKLAKQTIQSLTSGWRVFSPSVEVSVFSCSHNTVYFSSMQTLWALKFLKEITLFFLFHPLDACSSFSKRHLHKPVAMVQPPNSFSVLWQLATS